MAIAPRDIPITREMVAQWIAEARAAKVSRRTYIRQKIDDLNLEDPFVDIRGRDDIYGRRIHIKELLELDFGSYA